MIDAQVKKFVRASLAKARDLEKGDMRARSEHGLEAASAFEALRQHGDKGREALTPLLVHESPSVRVSAAAYLLRYCHDRARAVLEKEAKGEGFVAFEAAQALERWQEGSWQLDPE